MPLFWPDLEERLAMTSVKRLEAIIEKFQDQAQLNTQMSEFFADFGSAYGDMSRDPKYSSRRVGEAYLIKWHPQRTDNVLLLIELHPECFSVDDAAILDVGSGSGASHTALSIASSDGLIPNCDVVFVEPNVSLRLMTRLSISETKGHPNYTPCDYSFHEAISCQELYLLRDSLPKIHNTIFHHTFPKLEPADVPRVQVQVLGIAYGLREGSYLTFTCPKDKISQTGHIVSELLGHGWHEYRSDEIMINKKRSSYVKPYWKPRGAHVALNAICKIAEEHGFSPPVDMSDDMALPWYGTRMKYWILQKD